MRALMTKAVKDVTRRKGRTLLVVLGIFIGIVGLTAINVAEDTIIAAYAYSLSGPRPDITIQINRVDPALLPQLKAVPNVQLVQYESIYRTSWLVSRTPGHLDMFILSYPDLAHVPLTPIQLASGRYPSAPGEIAMEYGDRGLQSVEIGDTVTVETPGGTQHLTVVGLVRTQGANPVGNDQATGYMSDAGLAQLAAVGGGNEGAVGQQLYSHWIEVKVADSAQVSATAGALRQALNTGGSTILSLNIPSTRALPLDALEGVFALLRLLAAVAVTLSGILILNTITTQIAEQTATIGTMKAIGATRGTVLRGYLSSVAIYSLLGTLPGIALGLAGGYALGVQLASMIPVAAGPLEFTPWIVALSLAVGLGVPLVAALLPLWIGTGISVRDALAAYGVTPGGGRGALAWAGEHLPFVAQTTWLGLRGVFRKRGRTALTLLTLTLAGICFLVVQTASASVSAAVAAIDANFAADVLVRIHQPETPAQVQSQLASVANVAQIERFDDASATTSWGTIRLIGVEPESQLYRYQLTSGRWLQPGETGAALISDDAAQKTGLHVGDALALSGEGGAASWTIIGTVREGVDVPGWIGAAVTSASALYQFVGLPHSETSGVEFMLRAQNRSPDAVDQLARQVDAALNGTDITGRTARIASVETFADYTARRQANWYTFYELLYAVALIVAAVGSLGLANALTASVLERRREIGMLRSMGATGRRVARVFWVEGMTLGGIAWVIGGLVGLPVAYGFVQFVRAWVIPVRMVVDPLPFVVMLVAIVAIGTLASIAPALRASRMRLAETLRYE